MTQKGALFGLRGDSDFVNLIKRNQPVIGQHSNCRAGDSKFNMKRTEAFQSNGDISTILEYLKAIVLVQRQSSIEGEDSLLFVSNPYASDASWVIEYPKHGTILTSNLVDEQIIMLWLLATSTLLSGINAMNNLINREKDPQIIAYFTDAASYFNWLVTLTNKVVYMGYDGYTSIIFKSGFCRALEFISLALKFACDCNQQTKEDCINLNASATLYSAWMFAEKACKEAVGTGRDDMGFELLTEFVKIRDDLQRWFRLYEAVRYYHKTEEGAAQIAIDYATSLEMSCENVRLLSCIKTVTRILISTASNKANTSTLARMFKYAVQYVNDTVPKVPTHTYQIKSTGHMMGINKLKELMDT